MARIAAIGLIDHDTILHLDHLPGPGESAIVTSVTTAPGGTTANSIVALARLGESVTFRALVGNDARGRELLGRLAAEGVDCSMITVVDQPTDASTILHDTGSGERTVLWHQGAMIRKGDQLDIAELFDHDVVILDMADEPLRRFLTDLPAHTRPDVRLLGPITYIVDNAEPDAIEIAFRFDTIVGTEHQYLRLLGLENAEDLVVEIQRRMSGANLRTAFVTNGSHGCRWIIRNESGRSPAYSVTTVDTTGAGDAFVAGVAWSMARRSSPPDTARFANAVAALSTRSVGAQTSLPTLAEVDALIGA